MSERKAFWAKCADCDHIWELCGLPLDMKTFGEVMKRAKCGKCGAGPKRIAPAKQKNGVLQEYAE